MPCLVLYNNFYICIAKPEDQNIIEQITESNPFRKVYEVAFLVSVNKFKTSFGNKAT